MVGRLSGGAVEMAKLSSFDNETTAALIDGFTSIHDAGHDFVDLLRVDFALLALHYSHDLPPYALVCAGSSGAGSSSDARSRSRSGG
jgi:hypothetical protein